MKTQSFFRASIAATLLASSLLLTNCQPTNGEKGDPGPQGEQGIQGPKGDPGPQGAVGTANVIYSNWIDMSNPSKWRRNNPSYWEATLVSTTSISQSIINSGVVLVYMKSSISPRVMLTPFTALGNYFTIYSNVFVGSISLWQQFPASNSPVNLDLQGWNSYRYVIIPGSVPGGRKISIDYSNYEEVKKAFNLPD